MRQISTSVILAMTVPRATPVTPSFGSPNSPKIKVALQITLTHSETMYVTEGSIIFPMLRRALIKTWENPININENEITLKYSLPAAIVSGLLVKIFMIVVGIEKEITKNTREKISEIRSARPRIAANAELAKLQTTSFIIAGVAIFIKSWNRIPDFAKKYFIRNLTSELLNE